MTGKNAAMMEKNEFKQDTTGKKVLQRITEKNLHQHVVLTIDQRKVVNVLSTGPDSLSTKKK